VDEYEREFQQELRQTETFDRIQALVAQGYRPDWNVSVEGAIWFDHPGDAPNIILYSDGMVAARDGLTVLNPDATEDRNRICNIDADDRRLFSSWINSVPLPSWQQRTRVDRERYTSLLVFWLMMIGLWWFAYKAVEWLWKAITG
jgi:hypothetical protein